MGGAVTGGPAGNLDGIFNAGSAPHAKRGIETARIKR
jgi:hypothetical protein